MWVCHRRCRLACWHVVVCGYYTLVSVGSLLHVGVPSSVSACMLAYCCMRLLHTCQWWLLVACGCAIVGVGLHVGLLLYAVITQASVLAHCCMLACYCMRLLHKCQCWLIVACWLVIVCGYYTSVSVGSLLHVGLFLYAVITQVSVLAHCCMLACYCMRLLHKCQCWLIVACGCAIVGVGLLVGMLLYAVITHLSVVAPCCMWVCHRRCRLAFWHIVVCAYYTLVSGGSLLHVGVPSSVSACMLACYCMRLLHKRQCWLIVACWLVIVCGYYTSVSVGSLLHVGLLLYAVITQVSVLAHCCTLACYCIQLLHKCQCWLIVACGCAIVGAGSRLGLLSSVGVRT